MNQVIYKISRNSQILYIGQTVDFGRRKNHHFTRLSAGLHANQHLQRIYTKYGGLEMTTVEEVPDRDLLTQREIYYIKLLKPTCNMQVPNENDSWSFTEERNKKVSLSNLGKVKSFSHRLNISRSKIGEKNPRYGETPWNKGSGDYMKGEFNHFFGKHHSNESKLKISIAKRIPIDINKVVALREEGYTYSQIALEIGVSVKTLRKRVRE